eukprot:CAMPEP_0185830808 /NCGR_PEP_ID=MMETSP1353-20130828/1100_1 /TAXON_ID=1077150 /ORGANISM="Erythrolobus australicus, Strain CCMP3124" /LENGTH=282 /DNA_ID=CAMNT_0028528793 /DNA_START=132 /DNA_END=980 /DNA_ORIENTATION=+
MTIWTDKVLLSRSAASGGVGGALVVGRREKAYVRAKLIGNDEDSHGKWYRCRNALAKKYNELLEQRKGLVGAVCAPGELFVPLRDKDGQVLHFIPVSPEGNCGFKTLALGMNLLKVGVPSDDLAEESGSLVTEISGRESSRDTLHERPRKRNTTDKVTGDLVRNKIRDEVAENRAVYIIEASKNEAFHYMVQQCSIDMFCRSVVNSGDERHWFGSKWGSMEVVAAARALGICIELYTYDRESKRLRMYESFARGPVKIGLLFSGVGDLGHFDLLVHPDPRKA